MGIIGDVVGSLEGKVPILGIRYSQLLLAALIMILGFILVKIMVPIFKKSPGMSSMPKLMIDFLANLQKP